VVGYAELDRMVRHVAAALTTAGLGPRDIVGIQVPGNRLAVAAELGVAAIGAVSLPIPVGRGYRDALSLLGRSRAGGLVIDPAAADPIPVDQLPYLRARLTLEADSGPAPPRPRVRIDPDAPARILVSSGSETEPKMVAYSHNAFAGGRATYVRALHRGASPMRNLVLVPLASSFGSCGVPVTIAALGATLILQQRFDPAGAVRLIHQHRPTHVFGVPTMLSRTASVIPEPGPEGLLAVVSSGAALPPATEQVCRAGFGVQVISVYGSTDGVNCHNATDGRPDPAVAAITITGTGEICALGPMTPMSYVAAPELNARYRPPGGWVRTGDQGVVDEHGVLHVTGRLKQVVIRGGHTISPAEVEAHLADHPAVSEAACVGLPDPDLGERLCACVVPQAGHSPLTLALLTEFLRRRGVEPRKLPERLMVLPALPLGPTGKICRTTLTAWQHLASR
jgi:acyl-CoA synthetase (AMP-forming)/AMP-acid ligase II